MAPRATWLHHLEDEADAGFLYREPRIGEASSGGVGYLVEEWIVL